MNGNYAILNKQNGFGDTLDNEKFPGKTKICKQIIYIVGGGMIV